jgi:hypothetical protein
MMPGYEISVHANTQDVTCAIKRIISKVTLKNGMLTFGPFRACKPLQ